MLGMAPPVDPEEHGPVVTARDGQIPGALNDLVLDLGRKIVELAEPELLEERKKSAPAVDKKLIPASIRSAGTINRSPTARSIVLVQDEAGAHYAKWLEFGTGPHVIKPKSPSGVLSWIPGGGGDRLFAKSVNHPGSVKHKGWWSEWGDEEFENVLDRAADRAVRQL